MLLNSNTGAIREYSQLGGALQDGNGSGGTNLTENATFDNASFYAALDAHRAGKQLTWRQVAAAAGVSASTLTRMAQGRLPDVAGLARLCAWSGLSANDFIRTHRVAEPPETLAKISTYLRADPNLEPETAAMLDKLIRSTYETFRKKHTDGQP